MSGPSLTRRQAIATVAAVAVQLHGKPVAAQGGPVLTIVLDGMAAIAVRYRGQVVTIAPQELMDVLRGTK